MSWSVLLSSYPAPLLDSPVALRILCFVESQGHVTHESLSASLELEPSVIASVTHSLVSNGMLRVAGDALMIAERGKFLIDRFDLGETIIDDLLSETVLHGEAREQIRESLLTFRHTSFSEYLGSVLTIRLWMSEGEHLLSQVVEKPAQLKATMHFCNSLLLTEALEEWVGHKILHLLPPGDSLAAESSGPQSVVDAGLAANVLGEAVNIVKVFQKTAKEAAQRNTFIHFSSDASVKRVVGFGSQDIACLNRLLDAGSIREYAFATGISISEAISLLLDVKNKCESLLTQDGGSGGTPPKSSRTSWGFIGR